jgi:hypothetical protein
MKPIRDTYLLSLQNETSNTGRILKLSAATISSPQLSLA